MRQWDRFRRAYCEREVVPPFSPQDAVWELSKAVEPYKITRVFGDRYAGEWPREQFSRRSIRYEPAAKPKNELYVNLLPLLNQGSIVLPDQPRLINQISSLERRVHRGGRDSIDHAPGAHDDLTNVVALAAFAAQSAKGGEIRVYGAIGLY